jgi:PPP family 3-phenylpropionic acid transporter
VGGGWLISHLGFAAVFWAASACALAAWVSARQASRAAVG